MAFLGPLEVQEFLVICLEVKLWLTLSLLECTHSLSVSNIFVQRLEHSASKCQVLEVSMGVLATLICKLLSVIAYTGNSNVEVPRNQFVPLILVGLPPLPVHVLSDPLPGASLNGGIKNP